MADQLMCPHCGELFGRQHLVAGRLIPIHTLPITTATLLADQAPVICPGSEQNPRNPETDRRQLWKDLPIVKEK